MKNPELNQKTPQPSVKEQEQGISFIKQVVADVEQFQNDPEKFSRLLTQDAVIVNVVGVRIIGRDELYQFMRKAVKTSLVNVITKYEVVNITFVRSDVGMVSCIKHISVKKGDLLEEDSKATVTFMLAKERGTWLIAAAQSTFIQD